MFFFTIPFQHVEVHLRFLAFILQEGALYLQWHRAREIWDCLVANPEAHESDKEVRELHICLDCGVSLRGLSKYMTTVLNTILEPRIG